jgi:hypothetical protein
VGRERLARRARLTPAALLLLASACANQTPVIPMLHVEPSAASRIFYLERRAQAMFGKPEEPEAQEAPGASEGGAEEPERAAGAACAPRTWGGADSVSESQGTSCDSH